MMAKRYYTVGYLMWLSFIPLFAQSDNLKNIEYSGTLVALPCTVEPSFEIIGLDMGNIVAKQLYLHKRTTGVEFDFVLKDCSTSLGSGITAMFTGNSNAEGLLVFDSSSEASGAAIGIETMSGVKLPINPDKPYLAHRLYDGTTTVRLRAYVEGDSAAIANQSITPGFFSATMTYTLGYE
ncbi:fimbrial protein [Providencia rettgeri]|uniref:fimbrial protein n=2 Tax=Morganellaceae TaxID=1903414 RepID=UPI00384D747F